MKLLLDQNLSARLIAGLSVQFPGSRHVAGLRLATATDREIWDYARRQKFTIVSKDADFQHLSLLFGAPPKVVWLRLGNATTDEIAACLASHADDIRSFIETEEASMLVLGRPKPVDDAAG